MLITRKIKQKRSSHYWIQWMSWAAHHILFGSSEVFQPFSIHIWGLLFNHMLFQIPLRSLLLFTSGMNLVKLRGSRAQNNFPALFLTLYPSIMLSFSSLRMPNSACLKKCSLYTNCYKVSELHGLILGLFYLYFPSCKI